MSREVLAVEELTRTASFSFPSFLILNPTFYAYMFNPYSLINASIVDALMGCVLTTDMQTPPPPPPPPQKCPLSKSDYEWCGMFPIEREK